MDKNFSKVDIINSLGRMRSGLRYLELCTAKTGFFYAHVDRSIFSICHRLMYHCPDDFTDGMDIEFRSASFDISQCVEQIQKNKLRYDIIFVDPWHEYATSYRDLQIAVNLLAKNGIIVVHDCFPSSQQIAHPRPQEGEWCGVTYKAYIDFVTARSYLDYCTVNIDYGCGIIRRVTLLKWLSNYLLSIFRKQSQRIKQCSAVLKRWRSMACDDANLFDFFQKHAGCLLKLKTYDEFLDSIRNVK